MWGRWLLCGFFVAGGIVGTVELASGPVAILACGAGSYENSDGLCISVPSSGGLPGAGLITGGGAPSGATAVCEDGDYSYSTHHSGTCSGHGGVSQWLSN
jgi:Protein of unknown function (DUF3761)